MKQQLRTVILPALFGLAAPYLWVNALRWLALHTYEDLYLWIWHSFGLKGAVVYYSVTAIETILFAALFGVVLRLLAGRTWRQPVIAFSSAFAIVLLVEAIRSGGAYVSTLHAVHFAALLVGAAIVHAALVRLRLR